MKETIYTIPVNEAFDSEGGCPFCLLYDKLEKERITYTLGASMMEPDVRMQTNQLGFCHRHFEMLFSEPNKLSLALVLQTHLQSVSERIDALDKDIASASSGKKSLFSKGGGSKESSDTVANAINSVTESCAVCAKINDTLDRYFEVFFYMYETDEKFRKKVMSKSFCLPHLKMMYELCVRYLKDKDAAEFMTKLHENEKKNLLVLKEHIDRFVLKFDYRNKDMPWGNAKDAPKRVIEALCGIISDTEENS